MTPDQVAQVAVLSGVFVGVTFWALDALGDLVVWAWGKWGPR